MPMLSAVDFERSLWFYRDRLGGSVVYEFPDDEPVFVTLRLGESEIGVGKMAGSPIHGQPQRPATGHRIELCVYVDDVDDLTGSARAAGCPCSWEPADQPWGERIAYVVDPDGNVVMLTVEPGTER